jgi:hypothetical protein
MISNIGIISIICVICCSPEATSIIKCYLRMLRMQHLRLHVSPHQCSASQMQACGCGCPIISIISIISSSPEATSNIKYYLRMLHMQHLRLYVSPHQCSESQMQAAPVLRIPAPHPSAPHAHADACVLLSASDAEPCSASASTSLRTSAHAARSQHLWRTTRRERAAAEKKGKKTLSPNSPLRPNHTRRLPLPLPHPSSLLHLPPLSSLLLRPPPPRPALGCCRC